LWLKDVDTNGFHLRDTIICSNLETDHLERGGAYGYVPNQYHSTSQIHVQWKQSSQDSAGFPRCSCTLQLHGADFQGASLLQSQETDLINAIHVDLFKKQFQIDASSVQSIDTYDINTDTVDWTNQAYFKQMESQARKPNKFCANKPSFPPKYKTDSVVNLSSCQLTPLETNVLARGFNFRPSLPDLPYC